MTQQTAASQPAADPYRKHSRWGDFSRKESMGGVFLILATVLALILANSGAAGGYFGVRDHYLGVELGSLDLRLSIGHWAADGLLAVFFFIVGLELKKEFVIGDLRRPGKAAVPIAAAVGGVALPALIYLALTAGRGAEAVGGWAIPTATDIAFAVSVLAVIGSHLPAALRMFLLTLAVVDDLIAITIIAVFYTSDLRIGFLALALIPLVAFALAARYAERFLTTRTWGPWLVLLPLGVVTWALFLGSGVHATIAGVLLAFCVPAARTRRTPDDAAVGLSEVLEHRVRPLSATVCVPIFAFFSAGVAVGGFSGLAESVTSAVGLGIIAGLVLGKCVGIFVTTWLVTRVPGLELDRDIAWVDVVGLALVAGIGFTVSLLIAELSFGVGSELNDAAKVGILTGSLLAAVLGSALLAVRNAHYRRLASAA
ncbi:Na+/H+ antiporter NhaA [Rothia halotolerans]|uniref:Na+/H+ antiporter NhaA n=1 Tax=Rothia halotolerans TaxID=405770 RepID=UPI001EDFBA01|nr:Na+/H+ antiporter NhaA [Rothia halotolerans]